MKRIFLKTQEFCHTRMFLSGICGFLPLIKFYCRFPIAAFGNDKQRFLRPKYVLVFAALLFVSVFCFAAENKGKVFYTDGPADKKKASLTFDDGPGANTEKILEILKEKNVKATFFMLGASVADRPKLAKKVFGAGHEIGNHTYGHVNFFSYKGEDKEEKLESEIIKAEETIKKVIGVPPAIMRYPYGYSRKEALDIAKKRGYKVINWSFGCDWEKKLTTQEMLQKYLGALKPGAIFLMHDLNNIPKVPEFLGDFIDEIKRQGYEIVTVSELLGF